MQTVSDLKQAQGAAPLARRHNVHNLVDDAPFQVIGILGSGRQAPGRGADRPAGGSQVLRGARCSHARSPRILARSMVCTDDIRGLCRVTRKSFWGMAPSDASWPLVVRTSFLISRILNRTDDACPCCQSCQGHDCTREARVADILWLA